jgi:hypothetical protein
MNATYCTEEKRENCEHWDADNKSCPYMRPDEDKTCFIAGIEENYTEKKDD